MERLWVTFKEFRGNFRKKIEQLVAVKYCTHQLIFPSSLRLFLIVLIAKGLAKKYRRVGRSREGAGHEVFSLLQGVGRAIFSYP